MESRKNLMGGSEAGKLKMGVEMEKLKLVNKLYSIVHPSAYCSNASKIFDTGDLGQYLKADAPHDLASRPVAPIQVKQPNGQVLHSTK